MRTALYTRVSTEMQVDEGFSLDAQLSRLRAYCESQGWNIVSIYSDEGVSAKNTKRPELQRMLNDIKARKIDCVLVYKLDRLTRSVMDLYKLLQEFDTYNCKFKSATEVYDTTTAIGRLFITLVAALAQWERENIAERSKFGQIEMTKQGRWSGGHTPFGYDYVEGQLIINEPQATVVRGIFERYISGSGLHVILHWLNDPGAPQLAPHERWTQWAVKYVLRNPLYAGYVRYGYRTVKGRRQPDHIIEKGIHEAIIDEEIFKRAERIRSQRSTMSVRAGTGTFPLSGILRCGLCNSSMAGMTKYRTTKEKSAPRRYYICTERTHSGLCKMKNIKSDVIEELLLDHLERHYNHIIAESKNTSNVEDLQLRKMQHGIESEMSKVQGYRDRWMDAYQKGDITSGELRKQLDKLYDREQQLKQQLDDLTSSHEHMDREMYIGLLQTFRTTWANAEDAVRKELVRVIIERIIVKPGPELEITYRA